MKFISICINASFIIYRCYLGGMTGVATYQATGFGLKVPRHQVHL